MRKPFVLTAALAAVAIAAPAAGGVVPVTAKAKAKTYDVQLRDNVRGDNYFSPRRKTIKRNDTVRWIWKGSNLHNVTAARVPKGVKASKLTSDTQVKGSFKRKLSTAGSYIFVCTIHSGMEFDLKVAK